MAGFDFLLDGSAARKTETVDLFAPPPPPQPSKRAFNGGALPVLDRADRELVNALAAYQLQYGKPEEALALLQMTNHLWPNDPQTLRLLTQGFLAIEDYASAEMTEAAYRRANPQKPNRMDHLREAVIHFGRLRLTEARASLRACFALRDGEPG